MLQPRVLLVFAMMVLGILAVQPASSLAAVWAVDATVSNDRTTDVTKDESDGGTTSQSSESFSQSYSLSYEQSFTPTLDFSLELGLELGDEIEEGQGEGDYDTQSLGTTVDASLTSEWWDMAANWERSRDSSEDPGSPTTVDPSWSVELVVEPASPAAPAFSVDFSKDQSIEDGKLLSTNTDLNANLDYEFWDLLTISLAYTREMEIEVDGYDWPEQGIVKNDISHGDGSTKNYFLEDYLLSTDVSMDLELLENAKFEISWTNEIDPDIFYPDSDRVRDLTADKAFIRSNEIQAQLSYTLIENLELSLDRTMSWDFEWTEDNVIFGLDPDVTESTTSETLDANSSWNGEISYGLSLTDTIDVDLSYSDSREKDRPDDGAATYSISRDYSSSIDFSPLDNLTFSTSFDRGDETAWSNDPAEETTDSIDDSWESSADMSIWDDRVGFSVSHSRGTTKEQGKLTAKDKSWEFELPLSFEDIPNLSITPSYSHSKDQDLMENTVDVSKEYTMDISYELSLGDVVTFTFDHGYSRSVDLPDEGESIIDRSDDTEFSVSLSDFFTGMSIDAGVSRSASDQNKDDKGPEVDYTYDFSYDWEFLEQYSFSFEYSHDKKQESEDSRSFTTTLSMDFLEGLLTVDLEHDFEEQLEGDKSDSHGYSIEVSGQF